MATFWPRMCGRCGAYAPIEPAHSGALAQTPDVAGYASNPGACTRELVALDRAFRGDKRRTATASISSKFPPVALLRFTRRKIALSLIAASLGVASSAGAAEVLGPTGGKSTVPAPIPGWTGLYVGGHLGLAWGRSDWTTQGPGGALVAGSIDAFRAYDPFTGTGSYFSGFQAGYNIALPNLLVLGLEADVSFPNTIGGKRTLPSPLGPISFEELVELSGTLRGRV